VASEVTYISSVGYTFAFDMRPHAYEVPCLGMVCPRWEEGLQQRMQAWLEQRLQGGRAVLATAGVSNVGSTVLAGLPPSITGWQIGCSSGCKSGALVPLCVPAI
jgi:hypothetical protein